jgi:GNAT superfamily N-acetyltransferase
MRFMRPPFPMHHYNKHERSFVRSPEMITTRPATVEDAGLLRKLIWELADFEKQTEEVLISEADLARDGFGAAPQFRALIAEWNGQPAGYALFFGYYSTWKGPGLYLEDLFVRPDFRGRGIGTALLAQVARVARQENCILLRWEVLHWNKPAIEMYEALGADFLDDWRNAFLTGEGLRKLADKAS